MGVSPGYIGNVLPARSHRLALKSVWCVRRARVAVYGSRGSPHCVLRVANLLPARLRSLSRFAHDAPRFIEIHRLRYPALTLLVSTFLPTAFILFLGPSAFARTNNVLRVAPTHVPALSCPWSHARITRPAKPAGVLRPFSRFARAVHTLCASARVLRALPRGSGGLAGGSGRPTSSLRTRLLMLLFGTRCEDVHPAGYASARAGRQPPPIPHRHIFYKISCYTKSTYTFPTQDHPHALW